MRHAGRASALAALVLLLAPAAPVEAQDALRLSIERADGSVSEVAPALDRGYAAVDLAVLEELGWSAVEEGEALTLSLGDQIELELTVGSPFFTWDGVPLQLADPPYRTGGRTLVPVQLLTDFFPRRLPDLYEFDGPASLLRAGDLVTPDSRQAAAEPAATRPAAAQPAAAQPAAAGPAAPEPAPYAGPRVVVIDAGHGGADPGALGPRGIREKDVALAIALELADILRNEPELEVHLTRDADAFVDLWKRGEIATSLKGDRPGVFVSIHANSFPNERSTRGFETYFLSDARTEHERRVAAIENAPLSVQSTDPGLEPDLEFILRELRNLDTQHWSALLAQLAQEELDAFHPGPNRGVKQGPLAVLTNALMPSVLVEAGYLSNADEGRLLGQDDFQHQAAEALARAILRFFERYPPGNGITAGSREEE
ncbi:MAG TPA: N-acetylmuramoyl-L-alanine amidase [Longimicrobiales bacterium]|nr:N-acetylmuramoyl-L-alanine amidase [Longimicrobiales bacterium]